MTKVARFTASAILLLLLAGGIYVTTRQVAWRSFPMFKQELIRGNIASATFSADTLYYTTKGGERLRTDAPGDAAFRDSLISSGVKVDTETVPPASLALILLGITGGVILYKNSSKGRSAKGMVIGETIPATRFDDVAAQDEAVDSMKGLVEFINDPAKYEKMGARIPRGMLLYGPPGTGKTLLAKALAGEAQVPFFNVCGSDFVQMYVGVGASRVRDVFKKVRAAGKAVLFIDEIDALGRRRDSGTGNEEREQTLNALLTEMSGFRDDQGVVVLAATNRPDMLDEALLRPGRFDRQLEVSLPSKAQRLKILKVHARGKPLSSEVDLEKLAYNTVYFSGAKLESLLNEAAILAARRNSDVIDLVDIDESFENVMVGEKKRDRSGVSDHERELTAYHEAGHALATHHLLPESKLTRLSIIPSTKGMAGYSMAIQPDKTFQSRADIEAHIAVALAGRAAEELVFGARQVTTGASNDLAKATDMCARMIVEWGMDDEMGLPVRRVLSQYGINSGSESARIKSNMDLLYKVTKNLLEREKDALYRLANALMKDEILVEERIKEVIEGEAAA